MYGDNTSNEYKFCEVEKSIVSKNSVQKIGEKSSGTQKNPYFNSIERSYSLEVDNKIEEASATVQADPGKRGSGSFGNLAAKFKSKSGKENLMGPKPPVQKSDSENKFITNYSSHFEKKGFAYKVDESPKSDDPRGNIFLG
jgi:hypothetical protein